MSKLLRSEVYRLIDSERNYQNTLDSLRTDNSTKSVGDYITLLHYYQSKLVDAWTLNSGDTAALVIMRKIAAIAVHCMEDHGDTIKKVLTPIIKLYPNEPHRI